MPGWTGGGANSGDQPAAADEVTAPAEATDTTAEDTQAGEEQAEPDSE